VYEIKRFLEGLLSKKFAALIFGAVVLVQNHQWTELVVLIGSYFGIEVVDKHVEANATSTVLDRPSNTTINVTNPPPADA